MARIRSLKPEFFQDRKIALLGPVPALVFQALWILADDGGVSPAEPERIKGEMFLWWSSIGVEEIAASLLKLEQASRITRYRVGDDAYACIVNFSRHQLINHPSKFRYPRDGEPFTELRGEGRREVSSTTTGALSKGKRNVKGKGNGKGNDSPGDERPVGWVAEAFELYRSTIGYLAPGHIGRHLKPLVEEYGWETVKPWFRAYCNSRPYQKRDGSIHGDRGTDRPEEAVRDLRFISPAEFVKTFAFWRDRCAPLVQS